ncbi:MAG TPA: response regulator [Candidatus Koribacter sp.]|jgi:CheY-like chemotaxis protein
MSNTPQPIEILLVEDNPGDAYLTTDLLEKSHVLNRMTTVRDGEEAINFLRRKRPYENAPNPDLILLDLNLPKKDGRQVLAEIKQDPFLKVIPVVILTSSEAEQDVLRSYELHANSYISKPVKLESFIEVIHQIESFWLSIVKLPRQHADQRGTDKRTAR